jgi:chromatin segregation and condensation protein Rec8/ScpA/Scc1 (kleisin family)
MTMEQETGFLSNENKTENEKVRLPAILKQILEDLNSHRMTTVIGMYIIVTFLKVLVQYKEMSYYL